MTHKCALRECPHKIGKWTLCDTCAELLDIHIPRPTYEAGNGANRKLTNDEYTAIAESIKTNNLKRTRLGSTISRNTLERIMAQGPGCYIAPGVHRKLTTWINNGRPVPPAPPRTRKTAAVFEQYHIDTLHLMVEMYGTMSGASLTLGLSKNVVGQWLKRPVGAPISPRTARRIEQWSAEYTTRQAA